MLVAPSMTERIHVRKVHTLATYHIYIIHIQKIIQLIQNEHHSHTIPFALGGLDNAISTANGLTFESCIARLKFSSPAI